jgi:30S ribosomal protein S31
MKGGGVMGKGDRRTRKGKIWNGSYGRYRPRKKIIKEQEQKQAQEPQEEQREPQEAQEEAQEQQQ